MTDTFELYEMLCDREADPSQIGEAERRRGGYYRTKSIRSGAMLEIEAYPMPSRAEARELKKNAPTPEAMKRLNQRNAEKKFRRLAEINFRDSEDYFFTGTIQAKAGQTLPTLDEVEKIWAAFVRRINRRRRRAGQQNAKYMAVIEGWEEGSRVKRLHVHALIEGGLSRDEVEKLWKAGLICRCERLVKPMLDQLAAYLLKDPRGRKRWRYSKGNLRQPVITVADRKITSKAAWRVATDAAGRAAALERLYPGYQLEAVEVKTNPYMPGFYITARLWRTDRKRISRREGGRYAKKRRRDERAARGRGADDADPVVRV